MPAISNGSRWPMVMNSRARSSSPTPTMPARTCAVMSWLNASTMHPANAGQVSPWISAVT